MYDTREIEDITQEDPIKEGREQQTNERCLCKKQNWRLRLRLFLQTIWGKKWSKKKKEKVDGEEKNCLYWPRRHLAREMFVFGPLQQHRQ